MIKQAIKLECMRKLPPKAASKILHGSNPQGNDDPTFKSVSIHELTPKTRHPDLLGLCGSDERQVSGIREYFRFC